MNAYAVRRDTFHAGQIPIVTSTLWVPFNVPLGHQFGVVVCCAWLQRQSTPYVH